MRRPSINRPPCFGYACLPFLNRATVACFEPNQGVVKRLIPSSHHIVLYPKRQVHISAHSRLHAVCFTPPSYIFDILYNCSGLSDHLFFFNAILSVTPAIQFAKLQSVFLFLFMFSMTGDDGKALNAMFPSCSVWYCYSWFHYRFSARSSVVLCAPDILLQYMCPSSLFIMSTHFSLSHVVYISPTMHQTNKRIINTFCSLISFEN